MKAQDIKKFLTNKFDLPESAIDQITQHLSNLNLTSLRLHDGLRRVDIICYCRTSEGKCEKIEFSPTFFLRHNINGTFKTD